MRTKLIFSVVAILGALAIYLLKGSETMAIAFVALVWGVYEKYTKGLQVDDLKSRIEVKEATIKALRENKESKHKYGKVE